MGHQPWRKADRGPSRRTVVWARTGGRGGPQARCQKRRPLPAARAVRPAIRLRASAQSCPSTTCSRYARHALALCERARPCTPSLVTLPPLPPLWRSQAARRSERHARSQRSHQTALPTARPTHQLLTLSPRSWPTRRWCVGPRPPLARPVAACWRTRHCRRRLPRQSPSRCLRTPRGSLRQRDRRRRPLRHRRKAGPKSIGAARRPA